MKKIFDLEQFSDDLALIYNDNEITYGELNLLSLDIQSFLQKRSLVFLISNNTPQSIAGYIAIIESGCVGVLIPESINNVYLDNLLEAYKPLYVLVPKKLNLDINSTTINSFDNFELHETKYNIGYDIHDDLALLLSTSGSTGSPKFVKLSYTNLISNSESISTYLDIHNSDRAITTMPMSYSYGLSIINTHLMNGASIILTEHSLMSREFWKIIKDKKANNFGGVPYIYEMLKKLHFERVNLPNLKYITQAGGKLNSNLVAEFNTICVAKKIKFFVMYGQTEATARMSYVPYDTLHNKTNSIGIAIPGGTFSLEDDDNNKIINNDISGELVYKGDNVSMGYAQNCYDLEEDSTQNNRQLYTGDLAKRDQDGFYYIIGRKKRLLKIFGNRVNLDEIEDIIQGLGYDCACNGYDDNLNIYTTSLTNHEDLLRNIVLHTGLNKSAFNIIFIETIPRNDSGKILYTDLD